MLKSRAINFENLIAEVEDFRLQKRRIKYNDYLNIFPNGTRTQDCAICLLDINPYSVNTKEELAFCIRCFNDFIESERYLENIDTFEIELNEKNNKLASLQKSFDNKENIDVEKLNAVFVGMKLAEIEYAIGYPRMYGSFDYGLDSGFWSINKINVEIWFQDLVCTSVEFR